MSRENRQFAVVTGASSGIGFELARCCAENGFDLLIAADEPQIDAAAERLRAIGTTVEAVEVDLATKAGVDALYEAIGGRRVYALQAMMRGDADVVSGLKNKIQSAVANVTPAEILAEQHRSLAEPGSGKK